jgi:hypothetical protein
MIFELEYLGEIELIFGKISRCEEGDLIDSFHEKTRGQISDASVPLKVLSCPGLLNEDISLPTQLRQTDRPTQYPLTNAALLPSRLN